MDSCIVHVLWKDVYLELHKPVSDNKFETLTNDSNNNIFSNSWEHWEFFFETLKICSTEILSKQILSWEEQQSLGNVICYFQSRDLFFLNAILGIHCLPLDLTWLEFKRTRFN